MDRLSVSLFSLFIPVHWTGPTICWKTERSKVGPVPCGQDSTSFCILFLLYPDWPANGATWPHNQRSLCDHFCGRGTYWLVWQDIIHTDKERILELRSRTFLCYRSSNLLLSLLRPVNAQCLALQHLRSQSWVPGGINCVSISVCSCPRSMSYKSSSA